jgi:hypothetical protein
MQVAVDSGCSRLVDCATATDRRMGACMFLLGAAGLHDAARCLGGWSNCTVKAR